MPNTTPVVTWSCKLSPTGRSATVEIPREAKCSLGPIPESINILGDPITPAANITPLFANAVYL